jgi:hypothetical protein
MIDSAAEELISFAEAANEVPRRRRGKKCHVSTIHRWAVTGIKGIKLESIVGGGRCTSREALARFWRRLTEARDGTTPDQKVPPPPRSPARRRRDSRRAAAGLDRMKA